MSRKPRSPRVLLINPNRMKPAVGPLGVELVADALRRRRIEVSVCDLSFEKNPLPAIGRAVKAARPQVVGLSVRNLDDCYYAGRAFLLPPLKRCVRAVRQATRAPVVLGGVGFSIAPDAALSYLEADYGIRGDGEDAFPRLVTKLASGDDLGEVDGLVRPGQDAKIPARADISGRAAPERNFLDLAKYLRLGGQANLETSRGCNRKCIYCADPVAKGRSVRRRDPESVAAEMEGLARSGVNVFHLCDSEFNLTRRHVEGVCRAILKAGLGKTVSWYAYALPAPMDQDLARLMAAAGCKGIDFSADAASPAMLDALGRDFAVADLEKCARACRVAKIVFMYDLLIGGPGESLKTMAETIGRLKKIRPDRVGISFGVRVFPETALAARVLSAGGPDQNPELHGSPKNRRGFFRPVFFVSEKLGRDPEARLKKLIDDDPIFLFASRHDLDRNYNYNNNRPLCRAIRAGERGAYWDILRGISRAAISGT